MKKFFSFVAAVIFAGSMMAATSMTCAEAAAAALSVSANNEEYNNGEEIEVVGYQHRILVERRHDEFLDGRRFS